jgi:hypothetical protein
MLTLISHDTMAFDRYGEEVRCFVEPTECLYEKRAVNMRLMASELWK